MKAFKNKITLSKNSRGCYILDTTKGCSGCTAERPCGCYDNCYAQNIASRYRFDFKHPVKRDFYKNDAQPMFFDFDDATHASEIIKQIRRADMPFIRIGEMGDPSDDWRHTLNICSLISHAGKPIVIITKHWKAIPGDVLESARMLNLHINTSISAMDSEDEIEYRLKQYKRLQSYCNSVLRIVSCDFNINNPRGERMAYIQDTLFKNKKTINTTFRPRKDNRLVTDRIINTVEIAFLKKKMLASMYDDSCYMGRCETCPDMCGVNL